MTIIEMFGELRLDKVEIRLNNHWNVEHNTYESGIDITYYFNDRPQQPFSVREFQAGSKIHTALSQIEEHIRKEYK